MSYLYYVYFRFSLDSHFDMFEEIVGYDFTNIQLYVSKTGWKIYFSQTSISLKLKVEINFGGRLAFCMFIQILWKIDLGY